MNCDKGLQTFILTCITINGNYLLKKKKRRKEKKIHTNQTHEETNRQKKNQKKRAKLTHFPIKCLVQKVDVTSLKAFVSPDSSVHEASDELPT